MCPHTIFPYVTEIKIY